MRAFRLEPLCVLVLVVGIVCVGSAPLRADSVYNPLYAVSGQMTITGNNVCTPSPCSETIDFSFIWGFNFNQSVNEYFGYIVPGSLSVTSYGALGSDFTSYGGVGTPEECSNPDSNYIEFVNGSAEIDLHECGNREQTPVVPSFPSADLYACYTTACIEDFYSPDLSYTLPQYGLFLYGNVQTSVVPISEGGTSLAYVTGGFLLCLLGRGGRTLRRRSPRLN